MSRGRAVLFAMNVLVALAVGGLVTGGVSSGTPSTPRFSVAVSRAATPSRTAASFIDFESFPTTTCQWPDGRTTITVAAARTFDCFPDGVGKFPIPTPGSFAILASPIGGAKYPGSGNVTDDLRFVQFSKDRTLIEVGPVLLQFGEYSGGARPSFIEDGGSLWIFDAWTERGAEVVRIATSTGAVIQRTTMPAISRPVIAVDQWGLWLGQDNVSLYDKNTTLGIWLAPVGAAHAVLVKQTNGYVSSMAPVGRSMDVYLVPRRDSGVPAAELWRFSPM